MVSLGFPPTDVISVYGILGIHSVHGITAFSVFSAFSVLLAFSASCILGAINSFVNKTWELMNTNVAILFPKMVFDMAYSMYVVGNFSPSKETVIGRLLFFKWSPGHK